MNTVGNKIDTKNNTTISILITIETVDLDIDITRMIQDNFWDWI